MSWDLLVRGSETQEYLSALETQLGEDANNFVPNRIQNVST
jgi:hypothetical protein